MTPGLTKEAADTIRHLSKRRRQAARELRARLAGVTDPAALSSIRYGAARITKRKRVSNAPKPARKGSNTNLEPILSRARARIVGGGDR